MNQDDGATDEELLTRALDGEGEPFGVLFDRHRDRVFRHVLRLTDATSEAEDTVAVVFLEAWRRRRQVRITGGSILPWLLVTANHVAQNQARTARRYRLLLAKLPTPAPHPDHAEDVLADLDAERTKQTLRTAFDRLSRRDREVLILCVLEELSTTAAAGALGIPVGTVKSRLSRAKGRLASALPAGGNTDLTSLRSQP